MKKLLSKTYLWLGEKLGINNELLEKEKDLKEAYFAFKKISSFSSMLHGINYDYTIIAKKGDEVALAIKKIIQEMTEIASHWKESKVLKEVLCEKNLELLIELNSELKEKFDEHFVSNYEVYVKEGYLARKTINKFLKKYHD
ncbi:hypothetical protein VKI21_06915 [Cyanobacterium aponinum UTEX 3222]|uniref:hypothetical protein n=1 Tax=Cyanobacterium aponinum TaxID=379064 RepID=UPI003092B97D|nr:hypothetical protein VKI21_06915 [Cyanobacterium aponinum UTEX 3222]